MSRWTLEAWRWTAGDVEIVLSRDAMTPHRVQRTPIDLDALERVDLRAHALIERDGGRSTAQLAPESFRRRAHALLADGRPTPRRHRRHVEVLA